MKDQDSMNNINNNTINKYTNEDVSSINSISTSDNSTTISISNSSDNHYSEDEFNNQNFNYSEKDWEIIKALDVLLEDKVKEVGTNFKPNKYITAPKDIVNLKNFLANITRDILIQSLKCNNNNNRTNTRSILEHSELSTLTEDLALQLESTNKVLVPTDKTNGFVMMSIDEY